MTDEKQRLRKSGVVQNPAEALDFAEWFSRALSEAYQDQYGEDMAVEVSVRTRPLREEYDELPNEKVKGIIDEIAGRHSEGAPVDAVIEELGRIGFDRDDAEHALTQLRQKGEIYEPRTDHLRST